MIFKQSTLRTDVFDFLKAKWNLDKPRLILSVTGGAKNFNLPSEVRKAFKIGLTKVAKSTGAWILTRGTNVGINRLVGEAVSESTYKYNLVVLGITNWHNISQKELLKVYLHTERNFIYKELFKSILLLIEQSTFSKCGL